MPWSVRSACGFLPKSTVVRTSTIEGGGVGRFLGDDEPTIKKGEAVRIDRIVSVDNFTTFAPALSTLPEATVAIKIESEACLDAWTRHFTPDDESNAAAEVRKMTSWFTASVPPSRIQVTKTEANNEAKEALPLSLTYILAHSFHTNHSDNENMRTVVRDGCLIHEATRDIEAGDELFLNYRTMEMSSFVKHWCEHHGLEDVHTMSKRIEIES